MAEEQHVRGACPMDCPDTCSWIVTVRDGRAVKLRGDRAHPFTRGALCNKLNNYIAYTQSPERLLYPMRRVQPKGQGKGDASDFARISWDEALQEIATRLQKISDEFGAEAVLPYSYAGTLGFLNITGMAHRFFHQLGASQLNRTICATAGGDALRTVLGRKMGTEPEQFRESKYIIAWGANIHGNNVHL